MSVRKNPDGSISVGILDDIPVEKPIELKPIVQEEVKATSTEVEAPKKKGRPKK